MNEDQYGGVNLDSLYFILETYFVSRVIISYSISCLFFLWGSCEPEVSYLGFHWSHYKSRFLPLYLWIFYLNIVSFVGDSFSWLGRTMHRSWPFVYVTKGSGGMPPNYVLWPYDTKTGHLMYLYGCSQSYLYLLHSFFLFDSLEFEISFDILW